MSLIMAAIGVATAFLLIFGYFILIVILMSRYPSHKGLVFVGLLVMPLMLVTPYVVRVISVPVRAGTPLAKMEGSATSIVAIAPVIMAVLLVLLIVLRIGTKICSSDKNAE